MEKLNEENLEIDTVDDKLFGIDIDIHNYATQTTYKGHDFYIVYYDEFKYDYKDEGLGWDEFEELCDKEFGVGNWGDSESYFTCNNCYQAVYLDDYYEQDYWMSEDGVICGNCVRENPSDYLDYLNNNSNNYNTLLPSEIFESYGYEIVRDNVSFNNSREEVLNELLVSYPNGKFIFDTLNSRELAVWGKNLDNTDDN